MYKSEATVSFLNEVNKDSSYESKVLKYLDSSDFRFTKDAKLNLKNILKSDYISIKEIILISLSVSANIKSEVLTDFYLKLAEENEINNQEISEAFSCASLLATNNVLYRFRHFVDKEKYNSLSAKVRMNIMMKPVTGKNLFELMSTAVSAVNGCEMCVKSHEKSLIDLGVSEEQVFEAIRIASVLTGIDKLL